MAKSTGVTLWRGQFFALLKKNFLLKARNRRMTLLEIFFPLYFLVLLMMITWSLPTDSLPEELHFPVSPTIPYSVYCSTAASDSLLNRCTLAYAPDNSPLVTEIMQRVHETGVHLLAFPDADQIQEYYQSHPQEIWAAVVWGEQAQTSSSKSTNQLVAVTGPQDIGDIQFTIQMNQTKLIGQSNSVLVTSGFFSLQSTVQEAVINQNLAETNRTVHITTGTKMFPQRPQAIVTQVFSALWALMLPFSFSYLMQGIISIVVTEKKEKLKEGMKMMGLKETVYWISWMSTQMIVNLITSTLYVVGGYLLDVFTHTPPALAWTTFMLYTTAIISVAFFSSVFFTNPKTATSVSMMVFLVQLTTAGIMQYFLFGRDEPWVILLIYVASLLIPPLSMMQMAIYFAEAKVTGMALSLTTAQPSYYPAYLILMFQAINIGLYACLAWYVSNLLPGEYGTSKRPWFFLLPSYWRPSYQVMEDEEDDSPLLGLNGERADSESPCEISIRRLRKVYPRGLFCQNTSEDIVAVDQLSLDIRRGEILALLGHNGAGKSTTIGMLTGLFPPTGGDAFIRGFSVRQNMDDIRADIGVCPQHDILFEQLTAVEHLELYAALKGVPASAVRSQVDEILAMVGLNAEEDAHKHTKGFSGGMKRKLSVAIALIGDSSVIFLDECTAGMDPLSRREIWKLLQDLKSERTIILTTHYMEEADILGDRIAIMSQGNVKVLGTSVELKNQYGSGYYLVLTKQEDCDLQPITDFLDEHFAGAQRLMADKPSELSYQIPTECMDQFGVFFTSLDENLERLHLTTYGIYTTTLEEVFLKIADDDDESLPFIRVD